MTEWQQILTVPLKLGIVLVFATLYTVGGRGPKWVRRFIGGVLFGSAVLGLSILTGSFKWWLVGLPGAYILVLVTGYGGKTFGDKLIRRLVHGLGFAGCAILAASATGVWGLAVFQSILAISASVFLGITNPVKAVDEEALIATLSVICVPFLV